MVLLKSGYQTEKFTRSGLEVIMILKKFCAAFMSVIMSVNLFVGVPQFAPANDLNLGVVSGVT